MELLWVGVGVPQGKGELPVGGAYSMADVIQQHHVLDAPDRVYDPAGHLMGGGRANHSLDTPVRPAAQVAAQQLAIAVTQPVAAGRWGSSGRGKPRSA
jgi:hypothetical protein